MATLLPGHRRIIGPRSLRDRQLLRGLIGESRSGASMYPAVTIGMPVYNGEASMRAALDSLLAQTFRDFELIISDNASTDATESICRAYAAHDLRVRYLRQSENIGPPANFKFVLDQARGKYFTWAACDDTRSPDFLHVNVDFLSTNPDYVASTSPNAFEAKDVRLQKPVRFALDGDIRERFDTFFRHCWASHGIFYSVIRTEVLHDCDVVGKSFIAVDWAIDLYLASRGKIHRTTDGYMIFGTKGVSRGTDAYKLFRNGPMDLLLPFHTLSRYVLRLTKHFPPRDRLRIMRTLLKLNISALGSQIHARLYALYCSLFREGVQRLRLGARKKG